MNSPAHYFSFYSAILHLFMGVSGLLRLGDPPSWAQLYAIVPGSEWAYPLSYVLTGLVALIGARKARPLRWGFLMSAVVFVVWAILGVYSMSEGTGGNLIGSAANLYASGLATIVAYYVSKGTQADRIDQQVGELQDQVDQAQINRPLPPGPTKR